MSGLGRGRQSRLCRRRQGGPLSHHALLHIRLRWFTGRALVCGHHHVCGILVPIDSFVPVIVLGIRLPIPIVGILFFLLLDAFDVEFVFQLVRNEGQGHAFPRNRKPRQRLLRQGDCSGHWTLFCRLLQGSMLHPRKLFS